MKIIFAILTFAVFGQAYGSDSIGEGRRNCFQEHVRDAIDLNKRRRQLYVARDKRAKSISKSLVLMEKLLMFPAKAYDRKVRKYHKAGIPILCADLIDMRETPIYNNQTTQIPKHDYASSFKPNPTHIKKTIKQAYKEMGFEGIKMATEDLIHILSRDLEYNCLVRHFLESIQRSAHLIGTYSLAAAEKGLPDPSQLMEKYIKLHLNGMSWAARIDKKAGPLQEKGIPIICQDVPAIPLP